MNGMRRWSSFQRQNASPTTSSGTPCTRAWPPDTRPGPRASRHRRALGGPGRGPARRRRRSASRGADDRADENEHLFVRCEARADDVNALEFFSPATREWFTRAFDAPTPAQELRRKRLPAPGARRARGAEALRDCPRGQWLQLVHHRRARPALVERRPAHARTLAVWAPGSYTRRAWLFVTIHARCFRPGRSRCSSPTSRDPRGFSTHSEESAIGR